MDMEEIEQFEHLLTRLAPLFGANEPACITPIEWDLTPAQRDCLWTIAGCENCTLPELRERLALRPGVVSELVDSLARAGLVLRVADERDRRAVRLTLTTQGQALYTAHQAAWRARLRRFASRLNERQRDATRDALETITEVLREAEQTETTT